jgi:histidine triad (HIT) family protein
MACEICDGKFSDHLLYENDHVKIYLAPQPAAAGHLQLFTKKHYTILEEVPSEDLQYMTSAANKISMVLFELLKVHGTNLLIQNGTGSGQGIPHFSMHVIPRRTDDNIKIDWELKRASNEDLENMQSIIAQKIEQNASPPIVMQESPPQQQNVSPSPQDPVAAIAKKKVIDVESKEIATDDTPEEKKSNNYLKNLERIP